MVFCIIKNDQNRGVKIGVSTPQFDPPHLITFLGVQKYGLAIDLGGVVLGGSKRYVLGGCFRCVLGVNFGGYKTQKNS